LSGAILTGASPPKAEIYDFNNTVITVFLAAGVYFSSSNP
jgi:hypothetical protein